MGSCKTDKVLGDPQHRTPGVVMVLRDATGKYTWMTTLKYVDHDRYTTKKKHIENPDTATSSSDPHEKPQTVAALRALFENHSSTEDIPDRHSTTLRRSSVTTTTLLSPTTPKTPQPPHHFTPASIPYTPPNATVVTQPAINESSVPGLNGIIGEGNAEGRKGFEIVRRLCGRQVEKEEGRVEDILRTETNQSYPVEMPVVSDKMDPDVSSQAFRLFLAQCGYLTLENRPKLQPLPISKSLLKDLAKLDSLSERECMTIGVLFCRSASQSMEQIFKPDSISFDFHQFVHTLGWPVNISTHPGYKGNLTPTLCDTAPYYGSRSTEVIFHVPYYIRFGNIDTGGDGMSDDEMRIMSPTVTTFRENNRLSVSQPQQHPLSPTLPNHHHQQQQANLAPLPPDIAHILQVMHDSIVYIVWTEDRDQYMSLPRKLSRTAAQVLIVVQPMPGTPALYWIRILGCGAGGGEDSLAFGPLTDGTMVSRHALGMLVRMTAMSAHTHVRSLKGRTKPHAVRRTNIEDICSKHKSNMSMT
ncbi:hypothetical protein HK097_005380, partial [Rhizophlyctis rosea]